MDYWADFIRISQYAGLRPDLIQAGGGNSSVKISEDEMLIKSSGVQLAELTSSNCSRVNHKIIAEYFKSNHREDISDSVETKLIDEAYLGGGRPSIETFLHSITDKFTLHTHPTVINVLTSRKSGMKILKNIFPESILIDYAKPGVQLAKKYFETYIAEQNREHPVYNTIFLKNHGLIVSAKSADEVISITESILYSVEKYLSVDYSSYHDITNLNQYFTSIFQTGTICKVDDKEVIDTFLEQGEKIWDYQFCPDCIVYCGKKPLVLSIGNEKDQIINFEKKYGIPTIIQYKGNLYIYSPNIRKAKEIQSVLTFSANVFRMNRGYDVDLLTEAEQDRLLNWDSEKYRQSI